MVSIERLLDFEAAHPTWSGIKDDLIVTELGLKPARYYQLLNRAALTRDALEYDPMTTNRIVERIERASSFRCRLDV